MKLTKTRIAPTPSGYLHLGNAMSFLITATLAKHVGAKILLRIDDLDKDRVKKKFVEDIFRTLTFLDIPYDEGPRNFQEYKAKYSQFHRMDAYRKALDHLKNNKNLFACDCSRRKIGRESADGAYSGTCEKKSLPFGDKEASWRLYTNNKEINIKNISGKEFSVTVPPLLKDFVVQKKDRLPAYQLTSVVDDILDKIDFIVRGKDLWGSSIAQSFLAKKLSDDNYKKPVFFHHQLMADEKNRKMSKSSGTTSIQHLIKSGMDRAAIYQIIGNYLGFEHPVTNFDEFQHNYIKQFDPFKI